MNKPTHKKDSCKSPNDSFRATAAAHWTSLFRDSERKTTMVAARECAVVSVGCLVAYCFVMAQGLFGGDFVVVIMAIPLPIGVCLLRTALAIYPGSDIGPARRLAWQLCAALAFVMLYLFEMSFALLMGGKRVPPGLPDDLPAAAWLIAVAFAVAYIGLFCLAHCVAYRWRRETRFG